MRFRIFSIVVYVAVAVNLAPVVSAQFPDDTPVDGDVTELAPRQDELIRQLESTAGRGGRYRSQSIRSLTRLKAWPQVDRWVGTIDAVNDQRELAGIAAEIGSDFLLRISLHPDLGDVSRSAIKKMSAAAKAINGDPGRLKQAIDQLNGADADTTLRANRVLMTGGEDSVKAIVQVVVNGLSPGHRANLLAVLRSLGNGGKQSLQQLALYGDPSVRANALDALLQLDRTAAIDEMVTAAFAGDSTDSERQSALRSGLIPQDYETLDAIAMLADRLRTARGEASLAPNDRSPATLWSVTENGTGVQPSRTTEVFLRYRDAYDAAQRLRRLGNLPTGVYRSVLAADLGYRVMVDVDWGEPEQLQQVKSTYPTLMTSANLMVLLAEARKREDIPASVALVRLLVDSFNSDTAARAILIPSEGPFSSLVSAVRDSEPRIRFEAASAISDLLAESDQQLAFPGTSYYRRTLAEMAKLQPRPTAILLETRPVVALRQETILGQLGYEVRRVTSALQVEREISSGGDFRIVVSKTRISDVAPAELVDRIRRQPKGGRLPIVFYWDADSSESDVRDVEFETTSSRWISEDTPAVYVVPLPGSPAALSDVLVEVNSKRRLPALSIGDRTHFRNVGTAALQGTSGAR